MIIIPIVIIGIIIIVWLQYPEITDDDSVPLYRRIFNRAKVPLIYTLLVAIIYILSCTVAPRVEQKVFMRNPEF